MSIIIKSGSSGSLADVKTSAPGSSDPGMVTRPIDPSNATPGATFSGDVKIIGAVGTGGFSPESGNGILQPAFGTVARLSVDAFQNLAVRGQVLTDEGSLRDDFTGSSLFTTITGSATFTNGSTAVTGSGTSFLTQVTRDNYIRIVGHSETALVKVLSIESNTALTLETGYTGASTTGATETSMWMTSTGTGATISVASSAVTLASGTNTSAITKIINDGDYLPIALTVSASLSQRIANQETIIGFVDNTTTPAQQAVMVFDGTDNTKVKLRTGTSTAAADIQETTVSLANSATTATSQVLQLIVQADSVSLLHTGSNIILATHRLHIPYPYATMFTVGQVKNTGAVTSTNVVIDSIYYANIDQIQVNNAIKADSVSTQITDTNGRTIGSQQTLGQSFLNINAIQQVVTSTTNSSTANLASGASFTGTAELVINSASTQIAIFADQKVTVQAQQSNDGTNWDTVDSYVVPASTGDGRTFQITGTYWRTIVTNNGASTTTAFRLQTIYTPMMEALPRALTPGGNLKTEIVSNTKATYVAASTQFSPVATATDVVTIFGSATKTIRILSVALSSVQTTAGINTWFLIKRSTANTAGTSAAITKVPLDSFYSAATATTLQYTVNPTTGTAVGNVAVTRVLSPAAASVAAADYTWDFTLGANLAPVVLRGTGEGLCLNFNGAAVPVGLSINVTITWIEE